VPAFRAAYLIHGDDHGRIGERRARLKAMAEAAAGSAGVEVFEADACTPEAVGAALATMTFALGRRFVIADGVERWKDGDVDPIVQALKAAGREGSDLTAAFFAREDARLKAPAKLHEAVEAVGGQIAAENELKGRQLPGWLAERAKELGVSLDTQAARALVAQVGDRRQRLLRELEKLALEHGEGAHIGVEEVQEACASSAERTTYALADALVAGDRQAATRLLLQLRQQGERLPSLTYRMVGRLREAIRVAEALAAGQSPAQVRKTLRMPSFAADRLISEVSKRDADGLRRALAAMADLELESRGGGGGGLGEETLALQAVLTAAG
jgi:DNA polymerase III subunit delta